MPEDEFEHVRDVSFLADPPEHNVVLSVRPVEGPSEPSPNAAKQAE